MSDKTKWDAVQEEFYAPYYKSEYAESALPLAEIDTLVIDSMIDEIVLLRDILAALREPSKGVVDAMMNWLVWTDGRYVKNAIRAAVAAAEQEVGRE